jgi:hypothetical protein
MHERFDITADLGSSPSAYAITPNDGANLPEPVRMIVVGVSGTIAYVNRMGQNRVTATLPVGSYPFCAIRVLATGTTASQLTGFV